MTDRLSIDEFQPRSELIVPEHKIIKAKFPVIDAHNHPTYPGFGFERIELEQLLSEMDVLNVKTIVNLSGGSGDELKQNLRRWDDAYPGRFVTYCNIDFKGVGQPGWTDRACDQLLADIRTGARGLKIYKELGLRIRDTQNLLVKPDDQRLYDLWEIAGEAGLPVTIHTADPTAFFRPLDRFNERWDELQDRPEWHFYGPEFPSFKQLMDSLYHLIASHPKTNFITAHVGCHPENLEFVSRMMERYSNLYTDIGARLAELGRAPYSARDWFIRFADRILFGTDLSPRAAMYRVHFRFLETDDEYFEYDADSVIPTQGRWRIYGVYLPDDVLRKVYYDNAAKLLKI